MSDEGPRSRGWFWFDVALFVLRALVGGFLGLAAVLFLLHGRGAFARFGKADEARVALGAAEAVGAVLFVIPRTALAGGVLLLAVLAWAAGFHYGVGTSTWRLWLDAAEVAVLLAATHLRLPRKRAEARA